ncbi:nitrogenase-stabilizing/protective protein NifW [uncultured Thiodictyon sp.]|uniref:nitrogenase-stabilizing/protective protein NifW n=1 Tax=uncultured Thiodictyon sp. TaxID=1846217 RepID=UPI0025FA5003|nr:nitrogenase-stabilizing/protective protein NifW [uncultured Thiodictyon sp.]
MTNDDFESDLAELSSAEDFLDYFNIDYDPKIVQVNRLHILQRFHDYLAQVDALPEGAEALWALHAQRLAAAYQDFVVSDARTEKVFRVFHMHEPKTASVPLSDLLGQIPRAAGI